MKQCPNCRGNLADYVPVCPYCGVNLAVTPTASAQPIWTGPQQNSGKATASMVCGVLFFFWPAAVAAVILGHIALSEIKKSAGRLAGRGMAIAGLVLGYIGLAFIPILIILAIAIPNILRSKMAANEASTVGTLRTYNTALVTYATMCPNIGYPKTLINLGTGGTEQDRCPGAELVDHRLATQAPEKNGYRFSYRAETDEKGLVTRYFLTANPITPGTSGVRHFFTDETAVIRYSTQRAADADSPPLM